MYGIDNKCLWELTGGDYIDEEVNWLLYKTRLEMHAAAQSDGLSPKQLNVPSASQQFKAGSDGTQNCCPSKGKKRDRGEQGIDPAKCDHDCPLKVDDIDTGNCKDDKTRPEFTKITERGGLPHVEAVEKLVHFMQHDQIERKMDFAGRVRLADIIAATESSDCISRFMQLRGLPVLNDWLQETHKGKAGEGDSPKETDKPIEELILALLRALANLPISLTALQSCSIGKSVNHLRSHKNLDIQKKAKCLVDNWKKRVDAEMKSTDAKPVVSGQAVSWSGKAGFPEVSSPVNRRSSSSEPSLKIQVSHISSPKENSSAKPGIADSVVKFNPAVSGSSKLPHMQPANVAANLKDPACKSTGGTCGPELPAVKEEKSYSSSQSLNNSQLFSSDYAKTVGSLKEDARRSTAASVNASKTSGSSARGNRRANNGLGSGFQKETGLGRSTSLDHSVLPEKSSQSELACEKGAGMLSDHGNSQRLIIRLPNQGPSPGRSTSGGSCEEPSVSGGRALSPVMADKHEQNDCRVKMKTENSQLHSGSNANAESRQSNDIKGPAFSEEGDKSPCAMLDDDCSRTAEEAGEDTCATPVAYSSYMNEKGVFLSKTRVRNSFNPLNALIEIKYSETSQSMQAEDDTAMNLLASVAGEVSKSELIMPSASPRISSANELGCEGDNIGKLNIDTDAGPSQHPGPSDDVEKVISEKEGKNDSSLIAEEEQNQRESGSNISSPDKLTPSIRPLPLPGIDSKAVESSAKTEIPEVEHTSKCSHIPSVDSLGAGDHKSNAGQPADTKNDAKFSMNSSANEDRSAWIVCEKFEDGCTIRSDVSTTSGGQYSLFVPDRKLLLAEESSLRATDKQGQGLLNLTDQKHLLGLRDHSEAIDRSADSTAVKLDLRHSFSSSNVGINKSDDLVIGNKVLKEDEKKEQLSSTLPDVTKLAVSTVLAHGAANGICVVKESKDSSSESSSLAKPKGIMSQDTEYIARDSSHKLTGDSGGKEAKSNDIAKLDFDLNEGIPGYEGHHAEIASSSVTCSSPIHLPGLPPFISPILSGLPSPITVAAPAKGPFVPPENLLKVKPEAGWKGSAATSAFRPAEPRKILGMILMSPDIAASVVAGQQSRPAFDIDLNVADDQVLEEDISQSSAQTTGSESGTNRSNGIELDLNRTDEVAENSQLMSNSSQRVEVTLLPARPLPGVFSNTDTNSSRNFDLNNGPSFDEAGTESAQRSLLSRSSNSIQFLPQVAGLRMNNAETSTISPWFATANPCAPVAIQSFLPAREQPYPIERTPGTQRIIAPVADGGQFRSDPCRAPVISTSPTMVFHPPTYQYTGFPFNPPTGFPIVSTSYASTAPAGLSYFPTIAPSLVGPAGALPAQHARQYAMNLPEGNSSDGHDSNWKWRRQGLDLNSGPASIDVEGKDERVPLSVRQNLITPPHAFVEEQTRMYQKQGVGIKRKEPEGSWDAERSSYGQLRWQREI